jgi:hypothetical protein
MKYAVLDEDAITLVRVGGATFFVHDILDEPAIEALTLYDVQVLDEDCPIWVLVAAANFQGNWHSLGSDAKPGIPRAIP